MTTPPPDALQQRLHELATLLTKSCLHPQLRAMGVTDWADYRFTYDTTPLPLTRPNPADGTP